ncbi:MAG: lipopolysaccharide biosynthesis protein [Tsuneonella sp.]
MANLSIAASANAAVIVSSVVALGFNTRGLGSAQFGLFAVIQSYVALISAICTMESWQAVCRLGAEEGADLRRICMRTMLLDLMAAVAAFALAVGGILAFSPLTGVPHEARWLAIVYSTTLLAGMAGTPKGYFRLIDRFQVLAWNQFWNSIVVVAASAALWYFEADLPAYIYAFTAIGMVYPLLLLGQLFRRLTKLPAEHVGGSQQDLSLGRIARMSLVVSVLGALITNRKNIALLMVSGVLGSVAAGLFAAAIKCTAPLTKAADLTNQVIFSDVIRALRSPVVAPEKIQRLRRVVLMLLASSLCLAAIAALLARPLVGVILDREFIGAAPILGVLFFVEALQVAAILFNPAFQARNATVALTGIQALAIGGFITLVYLCRATVTSLDIALILLASLCGSYLAQYLAVLGPKGLLARRATA